MRAACVAAGEDDPLDEAAALRLHHHGLGDARLWVAPGSGFALLRAGVLDLAVAPAERRRGLGTRLALAADATGDLTHAWAHGDHPAAARLAERLGLHRARELWVLRRRATGELPGLGPDAGVLVRGYVEADHDELLAVNAAAFADHPEQGAMDAADLATRMAEPWFDPAGLLIARDAATGQLLGFHWTKRHSPELGEVYVVGVAPGAQGRGLGRLLTLAGLHHLVGAGVHEILLYVESDNLAALSLYRSLGFTHASHDTHVRYARPQA